MSFDSSALQDIQPPDIVGGIAKGFQLKDMVDSQQLNQLKIKKEKNTLADEEKAKSILSSSDLSSNKGIAEASEKLTRAGLPDKGMDLRKQGQQIESGELQNQLAKVELHNSAQDVIATSVDKLWQQATAMKNEKTADGRPKYQDATVNAWIQGQVPLVINNVQSDTGLPETVKKTALQGMQQFTAQTGQVTYDTLTQIERSTKQGQAQLKSMRDDLVAQTGAKKEETGERAEAERERHDLRSEELQATNPNRAPPPAGAGDLLAALTAKGVTLPQGLRSKQVLNQTLEGLRRKFPDLSPDEIADKVKDGSISMGISKTEGAVLGRREAAILPVEKSITRAGGFLDQAQKAVDSIDFPKLKAAGRFSQWSKDQSSDPDLARYKAAVAELRAEYSIVLSKGGQVTDAARHEAEKVIPDLITKDQFKSIKQVVLQGIESSKGGIEESIGGVSSGKTTEPAAKANDPLGIR